jgi:hypothetical protein
MNDTTISHDDAGAAYHHGDMDVSAHAASYRLFGSLTKWGSLSVAVLVLMLVLWFCIGAGFFGGLIPGMILLGLGIYFLRSTPVRNHDTE